MIYFVMAGTDLLRSFRLSGVVITMSIIRSASVVNSQPHTDYTEPFSPSLHELGASIGRLVHHQDQFKESGFIVPHGTLLADHLSERPDEVVERSSADIPWTEDDRISPPKQDGAASAGKEVRRLLTEATGELREERSGERLQKLENLKSWINAQKDALRSRLISKRGAREHNTRSVPDSGVGSSLEARRGGSMFQQSTPCYWSLVSCYRKRRSVPKLSSGRVVSRSAPGRVVSRSAPGRVVSRSAPGRVVSRSAGPGLGQSGDAQASGSTTAHVIDDQAAGKERSSVGMQNGLVRNESKTDSVVSHTNTNRPYYYHHKDNNHNIQYSTGRIPHQLKYRPLAITKSLNGLSTHNAKTVRIN